MTRDARAREGVPRPGGSGSGEAARVRYGEPVRARVPATSANLGPGFDSLGLALGLHDELVAEALPSGLDVEVAGEGSRALLCDEAHLVVRAVRAALAAVGARQPGLRLRCRNGVPHGRGLGSSAAAVVAGVVLARGLLADPALLDDSTALAVATALEGHPDNAAAALHGGLTVAWADPAGPRAVRREPHLDLDPVLCVPEHQLATAHARTLLPAVVPHADAAANAARAALLVEALTRRPDLLLAATVDRLHQEQRRPAMTATLGLVDRLRAAGLPAVVSGAGPAVLVLTDAAGATAVGPVVPSGWRLLRPGVDRVGALTRCSEPVGSGLGTGAGASAEASGSALVPGS